MTSLDIGNEDVPQEHRWHAQDSRERTITIDEALSLSFKQESEEQVFDIRRELVIRKSDNKSASNFMYLGCKNQFNLELQR